jgi:putative component of membrane protein insertase Oxa1/YidC/SpoIIIJ protein YidD
VDDATDDPVRNVLRRSLLAVQKCLDDVLRNTAFSGQLRHVKRILATDPFSEEGIDVAQRLGERTTRISHRQVS